jgi:hypothetical protein
MSGAGPDRIAGWVVGIFSLSSHSVITIIMVWTVGTTPRGRVRIDGGQPGLVRGRFGP